MSKNCGKYCVGSLDFINKYDALVFATKTNQKVSWNFHDEVFSLFDWTIPITESIEELYKQRAQQLRDNYDYVSLFFSGGVDSTNILHAFIDNNIHLDEVIMFKPKNTVYNKTSILSGANLYCELDLAAIPHLKAYLTNTNVKVRIVYLEDILNNITKSTEHMSQFYKLNHLTPTVWARLAMSVTDLDWLSLYDANKTVAHIHGIDKPFISKYKDSYSCYFNDFACPLGFEPFIKTELSEKLTKYQHHELFYWTVDLPKLAIKQAQIAKTVYSLNKEKAMHTDLLLPYLYKPHVLNVRNLFHAGKPLSGTNAVHHRWINSEELIKARGVFSDMLSLARSSVGKQFTQNDPNLIGVKPKVGSFVEFVSKKYLL